jgi:hypothetical protein
MASLVVDVMPNSETIANANARLSSKGRRKKLKVKPN